MRPLVAAILFALGLGACAQELEEGEPLPPWRFHFPTGATLTPEHPDVPQRLLVVSSNTDLRYRAGRVHAFDLEALDTLVDDALASCVGDDCPVAEISDLTPALVGSVEIGNLAGQVAATTLDGEGLPPIRAFVPVRGSNTVVAVDVDAEGIRCSRLDDRCTEEGVIFAREDPFLVTTGLGLVFVGHGTLFRETRAAVGVAPASAEIWASGSGAMSLVDVGSNGVGGLAVGNCRGEGGEARCTLFANARSFADAQRIFAFDFTRSAFPVSPLFSRNLAPAQDGQDSRGLAISPSAPRAYLAQRAPDALGIVDVSRMPELPSDGCILPEGVELPEDAACPDLPPASDAPSFATLALSPAPQGPLFTAVIEREGPDGEARDLVVMGTERSLAFFDADTIALVANVETSRGPSAVAIAAREEGVRLYVPVFERSVVEVVDLPDLFRPESARLVASLGRPRGGG